MGRISLRMDLCGGQAQGCGFPAGKSVDLCYPQLSPFIKMRDTANINLHNVLLALLVRLWVLFSLMHDKAHRSP